MDTRRRPALAAFLSLLLPGLGHLYRGMWRIACWAALLFLATVAVAFAGGAYLPGQSLNTIVLFGAPTALWIAVAVDAYRTARRAPAEYALRPFNRWWMYAIMVGLVGLASQLAYLPLLHRLVARPYRFPSSSMEPTVLAGEFFFVRHAPPSIVGIHRRDLIVFASVTEPGVSIMKRVVGLPGDTLQMRADTLMVNGSPQLEPYTQHVDPSSDPQSPDMMWQRASLVSTAASSTYLPSRSNWGPIVVAQDDLFVLGDNRHNSYDSRYHGFVPAQNILGRPLRIYFSYDHDSWHALPFLTAIRWRRLGKPLR